ncbi:hypothetical protein PILCRDRAFT_816226 [Piloderma croceum F 1598]|uniref:Uncharacterized protein n=1 Tax=Piloderma croceum (strain F 1598) TaxID=765440 RepID=A0A0C3C9A0_PILCF|nr:hypothetical protein PILCRDRAFT_816226 [Piloderma croceum F 1598]
MTEYTSSPEAIQEYMSAKERTAWWIRHQPPDERYSPSAPPSERDELDTDAQSNTVYESDAESTHSVPPKMLLKYGDGRPDIPISHWHYDGNRKPLSYASSKREPNIAPSYGQPNQSHRRSRSEQPVIRTSSRHLQPKDSASMRYPEEIRILPTRSPSTEPQRSTPAQPQRRSKSQPRHGYSPPKEPAPPLPLYPASQHTPQTIQTPNPRNIYQSSVPPHAPQVAYSQTHPQYRGQDASRYTENLPHRSRSPPSIVYAPGPHSRSQYAPPALIHHQHGAPLPRYPLVRGTTFPAPQGGLASVNESTRTGSQRAPRGHADPRLLASRSPSPSSQESGSTYYVLPTPGQKVQIISPDRSTMHSTSQAPSPTLSSHSKKPFFSRFFNIAEKLVSVDSRSSSGSTKRLRRHSVGASAKGRPPTSAPLR